MQDMSGLSLSLSLSFLSQVAAWTEVLLSLVEAPEDAAPAADGGGDMSPVALSVADSVEFPPSSPNREEEESPVAEAAGESSGSADYFSHVKAMGDLLMLPKAMLSDPTVRKEVGGPLSLQLIRRIIYLFVPDGSDADYVSPSLLATINAEVRL